MENFHTKHLTDAQMKELNPVIRNAVYTALYTMQYLEKLSLTNSSISFSG